MRPHHFLFSVTIAAALTWSLSACTQTQRGEDHALSATAAGSARADLVAEAKEVMVAAAHPAASAAGLSILRAGGNAADAAAAVSFAISVVRPQSTGIGGGGFLLYHDAKNDRQECWDFRERGPMAARRDMFVDEKGEPRSFSYDGHTLPNASVNGHLAVGIPGMVAGVTQFHARHGRLSLARVLEPAIKLADEGFLVYPALSRAIEERKAVLSAFPASRALFLPGGQPLRAGEIFVQKDLARTLRAIAESGKDGFYKGDVGKLLVAEMKRGNGILDAQDLEQYQVHACTPVVGQFQNHRVVSMPPPSSGGIHIVQMLQILDGLAIEKEKFLSAEHVHLLAETMRRAFADRAQLMGDPAFVHIPMQGLLSRDYARALQSSIDRHKATPSGTLAKSSAPNYEPPSTTHLSVVDRDGNAVSSTQTINFIFGSGVVAEGTGVVLNDEMDDFSIAPGKPNVFGLVGSEANAVAAGKTMLSSMSPTLVFTAKGRLRYVLGSPGGPRIITAVFQTLVNTLAFGMPLSEAVQAPRIHHQWLPDAIMAEANSLTQDVARRLGEMGHKIQPIEMIGDVQAIEIVPADGRLIGVADLRSDGRPMGF